MPSARATGVKVKASYTCIFVKRARARRRRAASGSSYQLLEMRVARTHASRGSTMLRQASSHDVPPGPHFFFKSQLAAVPVVVGGAVPCAVQGKGECPSPQCSLTPCRRRLPARSRQLDGQCLHVAITCSRPAVPLSSLGGGS
jgi:hypothetical protein